MVMKVNFTAKGPNLRGKLAVCVRFEGSKNRNYKLVKGIRTRDLSTWDQERQMFMAPTEDAMNDNIVVSKMRDDLMKIFEQHHPVTAIWAAFGKSEASFVFALIGTGFYML